MLLCINAVNSDWNLNAKFTGDAFFLAFHTAKDAITFAMNLQEALNEAKWKEDILAQPEACEIGGRRGLRVRVGIHYGPVTKRSNAVTGRLEYTGDTLNKARETEKMADGGQILTTRSTFDAASVDAKVKEVEDDVIQVLWHCYNPTGRMARRPSAGSTHSLLSLGSAAQQRLSEGRKKRRNSIKKSISRISSEDDVQLRASLNMGRGRRRPARRSNSMSEAEAAKSEGIQKNYNWSPAVQVASGA